MSVLLEAGAAISSKPNIGGYGSRRSPGRRKRSLLPFLPLARQACDIRRHRLADRRRRAGKTRRWRGLGDAVAADENLSRRHVRMLGRFDHGQNRREADVGAFHDLAPLLAGFGLEYLDQFLPERRPCLAIHLRVELGAGKPGMLAQQGIKLRLDRTDRNEVAAGAFKDAVEMRAAVEEIALARFGPSAR